MGVVSTLPPEHKKRRLDLTAWGLACVGRLLVISSALSLLTMPITEHLWTWDRFLETGRDFELGLLLILTVLCLVLVLSKQYKHGLEFLLSMSHRLMSRCASRPSRICGGGEFLYPHQLLAFSRPCLCGFPLQV
jgi:hypothetical protein